MIALAVADDGREPVLHAGGRHLAIAHRDLEHHRGERGLHEGGPGGSAELTAA